MGIIKLYTIGFTKTSAKNFFERLKKADVKKIVDVRLHNNSQLAGFAKQDDLKYFLFELGAIGYEHISILAPTEDILSEYRKLKGGWDKYEANFIKLMKDREIEKKIDPASFHESCLLCSEDTPHRCHRRLIAEYLNEKWPVKLEVRHL